jgi:hypothetical protein
VLRLLATLLVTGVAAFGAVGSAAAVPPAPAEHLCTVQGGFVFHFSLSGYVCIREIDGPPFGFSDNQVTVARNVCEHVYRGTFTREFGVAGVDVISCTFS